MLQKPKVAAVAATAVLVIAVAAAAAVAVAAARSAKRQPMAFGPPRLSITPRGRDRGIFHEVAFERAARGIDKPGRMGKKFG